MSSLAMAALAVQISTAATLDDPEVAKAGIVAHIVQAEHGTAQSQILDQLLKVDGYAGPRGRWTYWKQPGTTGPVPTAKTTLSGKKADPVHITYLYRDQPAENEPAKVCRMMRIRFQTEDDFGGMRRAWRWCHAQLGSTPRKIGPLPVPPVELKQR